MAAILGHTLPVRHHEQDRWMAAVERLGSRAGTRSSVRSAGDPRFVYRSNDPCGFAESESWVVMLDGFLDDITPEEASSGSAAHLLQGIEQRGIESLYDRTGCFAVVAIDRRDSTVYLIRDRFGNRPLFYADAGEGWCWASEVKCLAGLLSTAAFERATLPEIFNYRWLAGPRSLLKGVLEVLPGHVVVLRKDGSATAKCHWKTRLEPEESGRMEDWTDRTETALLDYLRGLAKRFPRVGIPLSAGVDSSLLAALCSRAGFKDCVTISARYPNWHNPELDPAIATAKHLNLEHQIVDIEPGYVGREFRRLLWRLEAPARHYHTFPLCRILEELSPRVDVVLYGEGADTNFGLKSLSRLEQFSRRQKVLRPIPSAIRRPLGAMARAVGTGRANYLADLLLDTDRSYLFGLCALRSRTRASDLVIGMGPEVKPNPEILEICLQAPPDLPSQLQTLNTYTEVKCHLDTMDRMAAGAGVQVAVPFESAPLMEIARKLPTSLKSSGTISKPVLREIGSHYFPREWMYRPKFGFDTPTLEWLRGSLRAHTEILREPRTLARGIFRPQVLAKLELEGDWEQIWTATCLETLLRLFVDGEEAQA